MPKSEIAALKAKETSLNIQEGAKVATRVDGLRELWAKTEQDFERYKTSTLTAITEEITKATEERDSITGSLRQLKAEYEQLLPEIPLKRKELSEFEKRLMAWEKKLVKRDEKAGLLEIDVAEAKKKAESSFIRNDDNERISRNLLGRAKMKEEQAESLLMTARKTESNVLAAKKDTEYALNLRELAIKTKENDILTKELELMNEQKAIAAEKIRLADERATLARSIERIKAGRLA